MSTCEVPYLNIRRVANASLVGVLFVVSDDDLVEYDRREWIYDRVQVTEAIQGVEVNGGPAWADVGKPEYTRPHVDSWRDGAIRASYLRIIDSGLAALGSDLRSRYVASTDPVPDWLIFPDDS